MVVDSEVHAVVAALEAHAVAVVSVAHTVVVSEAHAVVVSEAHAVEARMVAVHAAAVRTVDTAKPSAHKNINIKQYIFRRPSITDIIC